MKTIHILLFCLFFFSVTAFGQSSRPATGCRCPAALNEAIDKTTRIYAGFTDKVTPATQKSYNQLVTKTKQLARSAKTADDCHAVLKTYTSFFKDSHVFVIRQQAGAAPVLYADVIKDRTDLVQFRQLDPKTLYIRLAVFNQREVDRLDSLLRANAQLISRTPDLIFDVRGNGGGNTSTSDEMVKLIYTNPIQYPSWDYRSSPELIESTRDNIASMMKDSVNNAFFIKRQRFLLTGLLANPGGMVSDGEDLTRPADVSPDANPKRIALLIDKGCGSSTEFFVFECKQSKKVTLFGTNTHGVMDYGLDQNFNLCDGSFSLALPWGRNGWTRQYRIDNIGFAPDVRIPAAEKDWIQFVKRHWARQ
ncbi:S41 family peptidase [Arsenicibacter rosenii]|uniref:Tail specific protease domain-containing protein n=1 Tax=Arsenicibacter rosenii TaxID=1750698 RepID=A0A1S2VRQ3_9BACT|nr:S41 family peptidase [Arsenicibacter rosenii]OIN60568.1 hypothetical protein BLX24_00115 [Arsenicibacter rosenii]